jgi:hypothetical protein
MGIGPAPTFVDCQLLATVPMTWRWQPQWTMSLLWLTKMSPKGVWPLSLGRLSMWYLPRILRGNSTPLRLNGRKAFSSWWKVTKSCVYATPIVGPW